MRKFAEFASYVAVGFIIFTLLSGCAGYEHRQNDIKEAEITGKQQANHMQARPAPWLDDSAERANLIKRLERWNDTNKLSYIYLLSWDGKVIVEYQIKGKVSSVNSLLTAPEVADWNGNVVPSPDLDGSYGSNGDAIFFFTACDVYVEWNGLYQLSDERLKLSTPPVMSMQVDRTGKPVNPVRPEAE